MKKSLVIRNDFDELARVRDELKAFLGQSIDRLDTNRIVLSVDEALANIVEHAYGDDPSGTIDLSMERTGDGRIIFILEDRGPVFDPTKLPAPNLEERGRDTGEGGLGVFLYMTLMDEARHEEREGGGNRLTLVKTLLR